MDQRDARDHPNDRREPPQVGSSVASHRRGERMRTYVQHQRPEGRM